jgi:hypothetical protein
MELAGLHDEVRGFGLAVVPLTVMLVPALTGHLRPTHAGPVPPPPAGKLKIS